MSLIKWWIHRHSICEKCQDRWKKIKKTFGIKDAPKFVKVKAKTNKEVSELMEMLFGEDNKENKND